MPLRNARPQARVYLRQQIDYLAIKRTTLRRQFHQHRRSVLCRRLCRERRRQHFTAISRGTGCVECRLLLLGPLQRLVGRLSESSAAFISDRNRAPADIGAELSSTILVSLSPGKLGMHALTGEPYAHRAGESEGKGGLPWRAPQCGPKCARMRVRTIAIPSWITIQTRPRRTLPPGMILPSSVLI